LDRIETNPLKSTRWFQYRLRTLFVLPVLVGLLLVLYLYWDDWRMQRPPHKKYDSKQYYAALDEFFDDLDAGRLDHAYDSTSARFKKQMSHSDFETTVGRFLALPQIKEGVVTRLSGPRWSTHAMDRNWSYRSEAVNGPDNKVIEFCVWVLTDVADDSFFYRRPPPPRVEEMQIQEFGQEEWKSKPVPVPKPSGKPK
jgi:hypothetical protein